MVGVDPDALVVKLLNTRFEALLYFAPSKNASAMGFKCVIISSDRSMAVPAEHVGDGVGPCTVIVLPDAIVVALLNARMDTLV